MRAHRNIPCFIILLTLLFVTASFKISNAELTFTTDIFSTGSYPEAVNIGDVNGDGRNDVVMTTSDNFDPDNDYRLFVFLQNESGKLESPVKYLTDGDYTKPPVTVAIGDINNDGRKDVVVGNSGKNIEVFLQDENGLLEPSVKYPTSNSGKIKTGDFNNDGLIDVVGTGSFTDSIEIFFQNKNGTLDPPVKYAITTNGRDIDNDLDIGDVNNDGLTDIIVIGDRSSSVCLLLQQPNGTYGQPVSYSIIENNAINGVAVGDLNNNDMQDIVVTYGGNQPLTKIGIFYQNINNTLNANESYPSYNNPEAVEIADVNQDDKQDIIVWHGGIGVYLQTNDGTFLPEQFYNFPSSSNFNAHGLDAGDINGDGANDIVFAAPNGLVVFYNSKGIPTPHISASSESIDFGSIFLGGTSNNKGIRAYNRGGADLAINSITITGPNASDFGLTTDCSVIEPGNSCYISVTFAARSQGVRDAILNIFSNDPENPIVKVSLFAYAAEKIFLPYMSVWTGSEPVAVAVGDVNNDGKSDVVMTTSTPDPVLSDPLNNNHSLLVFLQNPSGELNPPLKYQISGNMSNSPVSVDIGDVNNDGREDVVVGNSGANIEVFLQNQNGRLDGAIKYETANSFKIRIGDFNNDGLLDVAGTGKAIDIFIQNSNGTLNSAVTYEDAKDWPSMEIGDINNDGLTDFVLNYLNMFGVVFQQPDGEFSLPAYYNIGDQWPGGDIAVGDVNGDTLQDVVAVYGGNSPNSRIVVSYQNDDGSFSPLVNFSSYDCPGNVKITDINQDGRKDIVVLHGGWQQMGVYLQHIDGTLLPEELYLLPYATIYAKDGLAIGDINGNGASDIAIADYNGKLVVLYDNKTTAVPNISVSPNPLKFGSVFPGGTSSFNIWIYNRGNANLRITSATITGKNADDFSFVTKPDSDVSSGSYDYFLTKFTASSEGIKEAVISIYSNDPDTPVVKIPLFAYVAKTLFLPYETMLFGSGYESVAVGDVNSDGKNDVLITANNNIKYSLFVLLQNASGKLEAPIEYQIGEGSLLVEEGEIAVGDINNDGRKDIVIGTGENLAVFLQNEDGGLNEAIKYPTFNSHGVVIGDFNNDNLLDVVSAGRGSNIDIFFQNINGTLDPPDTCLFSFGYRDNLAYGDVNDDGLTDITVTAVAGVAVLLQQQDGTFSIPIYYNNMYESPEGIAVGDINSDGLQDIVVTYGGNRPFSKIGIFYQNISSNFDMPISSSSYDIPGPVEIADVNQDGKKDIIVGHEAWNALGVYLQNDDGSILPEELYQIPYISHNIHRLAIGDINGDGANDIISADASYGVGVLYAITFDSDGDGYPSTIDCDDHNSLINPNAVEIPNNGIDDDCNPSTPVASVSAYGDIISGNSKLKASMSLNVEASSIETGWFRYYDPIKQINLTSTSIASVSILKNKAIIRGAGMVNETTGYTYKVKITTGKATKMSIKIYKPNGKLRYHRKLRSIKAGNYNVTGQ